MDLQSPETLRWISNLAHWIEGGMFAIVGLLALLQALGYAQSKGAQYIWPVLILIAGVFLPGFILMQRGFEGIGVTWSLVTRDPQQREHFAMAALLLAAGAAEVLLRTNTHRSRLWRFVSPAALVIIGAVFFVHTEYGTPEAIAEAAKKHAYMGLAILLAGVFKAAEVLWARKFPRIVFAWIAMLFVAALLLISYREPPGAYENASFNQRVTKLLPPGPSNKMQLFY